MRMRIRQEITLTYQDVFRTLYYGATNGSSKPRSGNSPHGVFLVARRGFPEARTELKFVQFCMELPYKN